MKSTVKAWTSGLLAAALVGALGTSFAFRARADPARAIPQPNIDSAAAGTTAVLAGGCFWGVQGVFAHVAGVTSAVSGYAGGAKSTATYDVVSSGTTGHAESVRITYDPGKITYGHILQIYFSVAHDPTELNRQGPDSGTQYRSAVFPQNAEQSRIASAYIAQLDKAHVFGNAIVTKIEPGRAFFPAEAHHQDFLTRNPSNPYIAANDLPKLANLKQLFPTDYRSQPVLALAKTAD